MNAPTKLVLIALIALLSPFAASAATADVMVVVNGNTEVNRESYNFIRKMFRYNGIDYSVAATLDPGSVKAGQYKYVVVLNTGVPSGTDPVLQKFIAGYTDKKHLFLVNLWKGSTDMRVTTFTAAKNDLGVDGISAASVWKRGFGVSGDPEQLHAEWVQNLVQFLNKA